MKSIHEERYRAVVEALIEARKRAGLTQIEVAAKLKKHQSFVAKCEGCERRIDVLEFLEFCEAIGVEPTSIFREATKGIS